VPGCRTYSVVPTAGFAESYRKLRDAYYPDGSPERVELAEIVAAFITTLQTNARPGSSKPEPWPQRQPQTSLAGHECRKIRFALPGLKGSARLGRLIYTVHEGSCRIQLIWLYNHDQFDTRPPDRDLKRQLGRAIEDARSYLEHETVRIELPNGQTVDIRVGDGEPPHDR
jgi:hypothetical protein